MRNQILSLNTQGQPKEWLKVEDAACVYARGKVSYDFGEDVTILHGGISSITGSRSLMTLKSIIVVNGDCDYWNANHTPTLTAPALFARDRHICAYCGHKFHESKLEKEHIIPDSRGGPTSWMNLVSACNRCNQKKANRTPEESGMKLLYLPYVPNVYEHLILTGRNIMADQMDFLMSRVSKESRLRAN